MTKRLMSVLMVLMAVLLIGVALAWYDAGRVEPRRIEQSVELPAQLPVEPAMETAR